MPCPPSFRLPASLTPSLAWFKGGRSAYTYGQGVPRDYVQARQWYEKAAAQGHTYAQYDLGVLYEYGKGAPQDYVQAYKWYDLAGTNGNKDAASFRDALAKQMTPAQIDEAEKLAREWKPIKN